VDDVERARASELAEANDALQRAHEQISGLMETLRVQREELDQRARIDDETGLANRQQFVQELEARFTAAREHGVELAIAVIDVDNLKLVNEVARSHRVGHAVLHEIARMLEAITREADLVARFGSEEFAVLFPATTRADAAIACERIRSTIAEHDWSELHPHIRVTTSAGIAGSGEAETADELVFAAEARLADAKAGGRNRTCF
jgi:diguanylate cyclase (GGDEF)-like protein